MIPPPDGDSSPWDIISSEDHIEQAKKDSWITLVLDDVRREAQDRARMQTAVRLSLVRKDDEEVIEAMAKSEKTVALEDLRRKEFTVDMCEAVRHFQDGQVGRCRRRTPSPPRNLGLVI
ncbi:hypothetical protein BRADI_2g43843v3 [Brachypodium distachyon]|uniref:Uncharacterized protein n=1 Tax=Brachypodium distachyon TaxID=15368 RepID=A0A2K2DDP5_BRADI|nr:hypothetical protein BRADI_2g43843v3 [Brachypodium distachyon]